MPTAAEYRDAAQRYRVFGESLLREAGTVGGWAPGFVSDGLVSDNIDASIGRTQTHLVAAGEDMRRLARVCDSRSEACVQYADEVRRYYRLTLVEQLWYGFPARPASWVDL